MVVNNEELSVWRQAKSGTNATGRCKTIEILVVGIGTVPNNAPGLQPSEDVCCCPPRDIRTDGCNLSCQVDECEVAIDGRSSMVAGWTRCDVVDWSITISQRLTTECDQEGTAEEGVDFFQTVRNKGELITCENRESAALHMHGEVVRWCQQNEDSFKLVWYWKLCCSHDLLSHLDKTLEIGSEGKNCSIRSKCQGSTALMARPTGWASAAAHQ